MCAQHYGPRHHCGTEGLEEGWAVRKALAPVEWGEEVAACTAPDGLVAMVSWVGMGIARVVLPSSAG